jgi:hypothetical protein
MKKFICTLAAVAALAWMSAVPANALTCTDACTSDIGYPTFWTFGGDGGGNFGGTVSGGFTAQYGFTLLGPPPPGYESVTNSITTGGKIITGLTLSLYSCTAADCSTFIAAPIATTSTTVIALGNQAISLSAFLLPGTYFFELTGTASGCAAALRFRPRRSRLRGPACASVRRRNSPPDAQDDSEPQKAPHPKGCGAFVF